MESTAWKKCSSCKKDIPFGAKFYECSVSTCTNKRTGYVFCSVPCFERHLPGAKHRDAAAIEQMAPSGTRRFIPGATPPTGSTANTNKEVLIVQSKLKDYIRARSDMNTSAEVMDLLSEFLRRICDEAIDTARADGRKTVMARDFRKF
jgi:hypothetical protein